MTTTVAQVLEGFAERVRTVPSLSGRVTDYVPQQVNPPCAFTALVNGGVETMTSGVLSVNVDIYVLTGKQVDRAGYRAALRYLDAEGIDSVMAAINGGNNGQSFAGFSNVNAACISWRFVNDEEVGAFSAYGVVFPAVALITKEA